ncbi:MAG: VOC family protein [Planctomycetales bacterium]
MAARLDHVNLVVDDLQAMTKFYQELLGWEVKRSGTIGGDWISTLTGLDDASAEVVYLEGPNGAGVELFTYLHPEGTRPSGIGDPHAKGMRHAAFCVDRLDPLLASLTAAGAQFVSPIQQVPNTQVSYQGVRKRIVYFHDPEGNLMELCSYE